MNNLKVLMATGLVVFMVLAGCNRRSGLSDGAESPQPQGDLVLMADPNPPIADVPIPIYFKLDERKSRDYAAGNARYIDHVYHGSADKYAVGRFYRLEMSRSRWEPMTYRTSGGVLTLDFNKGSEWCTIVISERFNLFRPTSIHLQMWTTGRLPAPPGGAP